MVDEHVHLIAGLEIATDGPDRVDVHRDGDLAGRDLVPERGLDDGRIDEEPGDDDLVLRDVVAGDETGDRVGRVGSDEGGRPDLQGDLADLDRVERVGRRRPLGDVGGGDQDLGRLGVLVDVILDSADVVEEGDAGEDADGDRRNKDQCSTGAHGNLVGGR